MQIHRVQNDCNNYGKQINTKKQNVLNNSNISFQGCKQQLVSISADSFKSECAKKIYSKIKRYYQMIGDYGSIKDVKLMYEKMHDFSSKPPYINYTDSAVCLSINKGISNSTIKLYHKYLNSKKNDALILNVALDKNGQMFRGEFFPEKLIFERDGKNVRRIYSSFKGTHFLPVGNNDRGWSPNLPSEMLIDDSEVCAFEIFREFARLKTSII